MYVLFIFTGEGDDCQAPGPVQAQMQWWGGWRWGWGQGRHHHKLQDLVKICTAVFMFKFHNSLLPSTFNSFFVPVNEIHNYNTRLSSSQSYALSKSRTNYGIYNIRFQGPKIWNSIDIKIKTSSLAVLKKNLKSSYIDSY